MSEPIHIPERRSISGIWLRFNNPLTNKTESRVFEDCPEYKQDEWLNSLDNAALKRLAKDLAFILYGVCQKFDITSEV